MGAVNGLFVKGQAFDLARLLGDRALAERYREGPGVLSRLCPPDYHRFHFPAAGVPEDPLTLPGPLYSVSPFALRQRLSILWTNRRSLTRLATPALGQVLLMEIGATFVGRIGQSFTARQPVGKGQEKGVFGFGASACLTLFEPGRVRLEADLLKAGGEGIELYARQGQAMARQA